MQNAKKRSGKDSGEASDPFSSPPAAALSGIHALPRSRSEGIAAAAGSVIVTAAHMPTNKQNTHVRGAIRGTLKGLG